MTSLIAGGPLPLVAPTTLAGQASAAALNSVGATQVQVAAVTPTQAARPADREARPVAYGTKGQISSGKTRVGRAGRRDDTAHPDDNQPGQRVDRVI